MTNNTTPILVKDVMWTQVDIVDSKCTVQNALNNMQHKKTKMLLVDKSHEYDEYGVVLIADIASKVIAKDRALDRVNVYEIMNKPVISVRPDMDILYCARLLTNFSLSRCPVLDNGKIIGVVGLTNIVFNGLRVV
ncbi:putative signal-transduction protein with CBS domains [Candidatus Ruthia magnifica str. Cm (Calyptogena magnifica)]|uniref:Signal-transduction protein with CBS domains n=2 Tax=Candidatus Ruthturnera TaxID=1541743 RepID=A1AVP4_RUTMC|nr:CBS domain-containing protein [Candidatus Ruthturnera calyptogenae]ABL02001.1 putative signal-transduction protein with CBS domains [Candidatus Ruthia magnifica str. Cm (Calyptogena magnifica)]